MAKAGLSQTRPALAVSPDVRLIWSSDRDGRLGSGRELAPQGLSEGWHTITLTVTDSDGRRSSATARLYVGALYESYLPWIRYVVISKRCSVIGKQPQARLPDSDFRYV